MIRIGNVAGHHLTRSGDIDGGCDVHGFHEFTRPAQLLAMQVRSRIGALH